METLFGLIVLLSLTLLLTGLISPRTSMFWAPQLATRWTSTLLYSALAMGAFLIFGLLVEVNDLRRESAQLASPSHGAAVEPFFSSSNQQDTLNLHTADW
ncbi:hypothetical protein [Hymenobacter citatus]|uniref:hypothetical protein n=1 Tax=Hymenobacter citatus TaxID=2763506 RepID=UPI001650E2A8|nr:hypothetical protein [Hymenobacter citatus]